MRINIPPITRPLSLGELAPELEATALQVWVNPPDVELSKFYKALAAMALQATVVEKLDKESKEAQLALTVDGEEVQAEAAMKAAAAVQEAQVEFERLIDERNAILAKFWSQGPDPATHMTAEELKQSELELLPANPSAIMFLIGRTLQMIREWRTDIKNALTPKPH